MHSRTLLSQKVSNTLFRLKAGNRHKQIGLPVAADVVVVSIIFLFRGLSGSSVLMGGLSSTVRKKKDSKKERQGEKIKRKEKDKKIGQRQKEETSKQRAKGKKMHLFRSELKIRDQEKTYLLYRKSEGKT